MGSTYSAPIKELKKKENISEIKILRYIAEKEGYISINGEIQWRRFYWWFFEYKLKELLHNENMEVKISRKQFEHTYKSCNGRIPIQLYIYLLAIYQILRSYGLPVEVYTNDKEQRMTYTDYIVQEIKQNIKRILNIADIQEDYTMRDLNEFHQILHDLINLDNELGQLIGDILKEK